MAAAGVGATTGWLNSVGEVCIWVTSGAMAWAVSKTGVAGAAVSASGVLSGCGVVWTGLVAAVVIASAPVEIGAPVWLPALKFSTRSWGERVVGACGAAGLAVAGAVDGAGASMLGLALGAEEVGVVSDGAFATSVAPRLGAVLGVARGFAAGAGAPWSGRVDWVGGAGRAGARGWFAGGVRAPWSGRVLKDGGAACAGWFGYVWAPWSGSVSWAGGAVMSGVYAGTPWSPRAGLDGLVAALSGKTVLAVPFS